MSVPSMVMETQYGLRRKVGMTSVSTRRLVAALVLMFESSSRRVSSHRRDFSQCSSEPPPSSPPDDSCLLSLSYPSLPCTAVYVRSMVSCLCSHFQSSEMNVTFPKPDTEDEQMEMPIPEQFVHGLKLEPSPHITSDVSDLYSH